MATGHASNSLTELLRKYADGDRAIADSLFREIWPELHQLAERQLSRERYTAPVTPTELISELWLRNLNRGGWSVNSREHFYAIVAIAMRRVLIDLARQRLAAVRGTGVVAESVEEGHRTELPSDDNLEQIVSVGLLMERLEKKDPLGALIADMHYFAGYTFEEIAASTGLTVRQVSYRWAKIEKWLKTQLEG